MQLDRNGELGPVHGIHGTLGAELEVQRTIKRLELPTFSCVFKKAVGPAMVHVDNEGIIDGFWKCIGPKTKDADLWIPIWEELNNFRAKEILSEVEHVKAHRTSKKKAAHAALRKFVSEGSENADESAKKGAMMDGGFVAQARASTVQQEREVVCSALQYAASFHCLVQE